MVEVHCTSDGDKHPMQNDKMLQFIPHPLADYLKKMNEHRKLKCTILKYVRVPSSRYRILLTIITPWSLDKKELFEASISNFPIVAISILSSYQHRRLEIKSTNGCLTSICTFFFKSIFFVLKIMYSFTTLGELPMI